jgi:GntR family transcriptional repressor for pyruvate dehydrogenase complex
MMSRQLISSPLRKPFLADLIAKRIIDIISSTDLKPGDRLPSEKSLADLFVVSRTSIREAIKRLSLLGIVDVQHGRGCFVQGIISQNRALEGIAYSQKVSQSSFYHLLEVRKILEPASAYLAAERATQKDLDDMNQSIKGMMASMGNDLGFMEFDLGFHIALTNASKNPVLKNMVETIRDLLSDEILKVLSLQGSAQRAIDYHQMIYLAVKKHASKKAAAAMQDHIEDIANAMNREHLNSFSENRK